MYILLVCICCLYSRSIYELFIAYKYIYWLITAMHPIRGALMNLISRLVHTYWHIYSIYCSTWISPIQGTLELLSEIPSKRRWDKRSGLYNFDNSIKSEIYARLSSHGDRL